MTSLRSIYQHPRLISLNSKNGELLLAQKNPLTLTSFSLVFYNPKINLTITFYDINGNPISSINVNQSVSIKVKNGDFSKITWNDSYNYIVSGWVQEITPQNQEQIDALLSDFEYQLVPIGDVIITSPLDANGNLLVNLQTPIPAGSNTIGNVNVISLPPLPAGNNNIGSVNSSIQSINKSRLGSVINYSASANTNVFSTNLKSTINGFFYITLVSNTSCVVNIIYNGVSMAINQGNPINANAGYTVLIPMVSADTLNVQFTSTGIVSVFVDEAIN